VEDIDWSKIVKDAEFAGSISGEQLPVFYKNVTDSSYEYHYPGEGGWSGKIIGKPACVPLILRPSPSWNGQGLPSVGAVCEMRHDSWHLNNWPKVTVKYASAEYFITEDGAGEQHWHAHSVKFRPIRTPEQIAADERETAINELRKHIDPRASAIAAGIFDCMTRLGYRKP